MLQLLPSLLGLFIALMTLLFMFGFFFANFINKTAKNKCKSFPFCFARENFFSVESLAETMLKLLVNLPWS